MGKWLAGIGVLVVIIIGAVLLTNRPPKQTDTSTEKQSAPSSSSLWELMQAVTAQTCTFNDEYGNSGNVYVGGGKMRGDFTGQTGEAGTSHIVVDGQEVYMWVDGASEGYKILFTQVEKLAELSGGDAVDLSKKANLECRPWSVDTSLFGLPAINFNDFGEFPATEGLGDANELQCEACDNLPSEAAESCRQALGC